MLLRRAILDRIVAGEVDLAFRRWARPTVKTGGTLRTAAGLLQIGRVTTVRVDDITPKTPVALGSTWRSFEPS